MNEFVKLIVTAYKILNENIMFKRKIISRSEDKIVKKRRKQMR